MKQYQWAIFVSLVILLSCTNSREILMVNHEIKLTLVPVRIENFEKVSSIRLFADNGPHIAMLTGNQPPGDLNPSTEHQISAVSLNAVSQPPRLLFKPESFFGVPSWDIMNGENRLATVWTKPQSASMPLGYHRLGSESTLLTGRYRTLGVFHYPRFVRGTSRTGITAIKNEDGGKVVALFRDEIETGHAQYLPLATTGPGILLDGLLLQQGSSYLLLTKHLFAGPRSPARKDITGESINPGLLRCLRLNADLKPVGAATSPIGDTEIFEFDADISGDKLFLLATTKKGYIGAMTTATQQSLHWVTIGDTPSNGDLFSPSVLASGKTLVVAVIESILEYGIPRRHQLLTGQYKD